MLFLAVGLSVYSFFTTFATEYAIYTTFEDFRRNIAGGGGAYGCIRTECFSRINSRECGIDPKCRTVKEGLVARA
jgi:hypothetical protein